MGKTSVEFWIAVLVLLLIYGCRPRTEFVVEPISEELNHQFLSGERLDTNYFSTRNVMQYYQVSYYEDLTGEQILSKIDSFARRAFPSRKLNHLETLTLLFYEKKMFIDYRDHLYESAMDNDTRRLEDHADELLATIDYERVKDNPQSMSFDRLVYDKNNRRVNAVDTIILR